MWYIYKITNLLNGHTYIGQHRYERLQDEYMGSGVILRKAYEKYGVENFKKEILLCNITTRKEADVLEIKMIAEERKNGHAEYNITNGGEGFTGTHTENTRKKISKSLLNNQRAKGKNLNNKNALGNILSDETRLKMSVSRLGNKNNGVAFIKCLETNEICRTREWVCKGYKNAYLVAQHKRKTCKGMHFAYVTTYHNSISADY